MGHIKLLATQLCSLNGSCVIFFHSTTVNKKEGSVIPEVRSVLILTLNTVVNFMGRLSERLWSHSCCSIVQRVHNPQLVYNDVMCTLVTSLVFSELKRHLHSCSIWNPNYQSLSLSVHCTLTCRKRQLVKQIISDVKFWSWFIHEPTGLDRHLVHLKPNLDIDTQIITDICSDIRLHIVVEDFIHGAS